MCNPPACAFLWVCPTHLSQHLPQNVSVQTLQYQAKKPRPVLHAMTKALCCREKGIYHYLGQLGPILPPPLSAHSPIKTAQCSPPADFLP